MCGLSDSECDKFVDGEIIAAISDASNHTRAKNAVQLCWHPLDILVAFADVVLQPDPVAYIGDVGGVTYIRSFDVAFIQFVQLHVFSCTDGGGGKTDLVRAAHSTNERIDKIIVVSTCTDHREDELCGEVTPNYLMRASQAKNRIFHIEVARNYLLCVADDDLRRVCPRLDNKGVSANEFNEMIVSCLLPGICEPPTGFRPSFQRMYMCRRLLLTRQPRFLHLSRLHGRRR